MKYDVEIGFISKLLQTKDIMTVKDNQIKPDFFTGDCRSAYAYIYETVMNTGEVPSVRAFKQQFPRFKLETVLVDSKTVVGTEENLKFWCEELRKKVKHNYIADTVEKVAERLQDYESDEAYALIKRSIAYIESEVTETTDVDITKDTQSRKEAYLKKKNNKGMQGLPTGFSKLDYITKGLKDSTLTTVIANTGVGKALTLSTPVLTDKGFVPMKDIKVDTQVYARDGKCYPVTAIYPQGKKQVYRVHFEDGSSVDCCKEHLWVYKTLDDVSRNNDWRVDTLSNIIANHPVKRGRGFNISIPVCNKVYFQKKNLPLPPYVLGALIGDGGFTTDRISFATIDRSLVDKLNELLVNFNGLFVRNKHNLQYLFKSNSTRENKLYRCIKQLGLIGTTSETKFIPDDYLYSSIEDRLELVRGMIDTDGTVTSRGFVSYFTGSKNLCESFMFLVRSLGYRCRVHTYKRSEKNLPEYKVYVSAKTDELFSSSHRKGQYSKSYKSNRVNHYDLLKIADIEEMTYSEEMQCISVDSPDHTFICGDFIVTHNTWLEIIMGSYLQLYNYRVLQCVTEMSEDIMRDRYEAMLFSMCYGEEFNYNAFKSGALSLKLEKQFFEFLENDLPNFEPLYITTATGVMGLSADIDKYDPDVIFIDSAYLMEDDQGAKDDWLRVAHITRDLKKLAKRCGKPILINTQADKNTSKKTGPELGSIMYTQAIGQDSDDVWALFRDEIMINDKEMGLKVLKQREGILGKLLLNWNFDIMDFSEIYADTNEVEDFEDEEDSTEKSTKDNTLNVMED